MKYLAVLGRQPEISLAELESCFLNVKKLGENLATFESDAEVSLEKLGGSLKIATPIDEPILGWFKKMPEGKITLGISDYTPKINSRKVGGEALKLKRILERHGRKVRVIPNHEPTLSTATSFHNFIGAKPNCVELIRYQKNWYAVLAVQNINNYRRRDQERPARDAKVGMLPPKLAQILINLATGASEKKSNKNFAARDAMANERILDATATNGRILDPFCGTGVILQEALLMGFSVYGTDVNERMIEYSRKNLDWLAKRFHLTNFDKGDIIELCTGDATNYQWKAPIDAVACETYLGPPMSVAPVEIKLRDAQQECGRIVYECLRNLSGQLESGVGLALATPAWLRPDGSYQRLKVLDEVENLGYNVMKYKSTRMQDLLYHREGQIVARAIIVLRKK